MRRRPNAQARAEDSMRKSKSISIKQKRNLIIFSLMDSLFWAYYSVFAGFLTTYFLQKGMSNSMLGVDMSLYMAFSFIGSFAIGALCDKRRTNRRVFLPFFISTLLLGLACYFLASRSIVLTFILYPLIGVSFTALGASLDTWMLRAFCQDSSLYGKARGIGSAGYAVASLILGQLINRWGFGMIPAATILLGCLDFLLVLFTKEVPFEEKTSVGADAAADNRVDFKQLFTNKPFMVMLLIIFFIGLANTPITNLKMVFLKNVGGDIAVIGLDAFIAVLVQALFIFISGSLSRIPIKTRMFLMSLSLFTTMVLTALAQNPAVVILGSVMSNLSYGIMLPTNREIVSRNVPKELNTTANTISDTVYGNFAAIIGLSYSGFLMDSLGPRAVAVLGGIITLPLTLVTLGMAIRSRRQL